MNKGLKALAGGVVALVPMIASAANAGEMTLSDLQRFCTAGDDADRNACRFFIYGAIERFTLADGSAGKANLCMPNNVQQDAMEFIVKTAIGEDLMFFPDDRNMPAVSFVAAAMAKQCPCGK
jgi:hypothetical protein